MKYFIEASAALIHRDLEIKRNVSLYIEDGIIESIGLSGFSVNSNVLKIDLRGGIVIPSLVNSHIHTADIGFEEIGWDLDIDSVVGEPYGLKYLLLKKYREETSRYIARSLRLSLETGVMILNDFREGGLEGLRHSVEAAREIKDLIYIPSYMPDLERETEDLEKSLRTALEKTKWVGISSPHYYTDDQLKKIDSIARETDSWIITHVAETREVREERDLEKISSLDRVRAVVHALYLNYDEISELSDRGVTFILCPRSNMWFGSGYINIDLFKLEEVRIALGTDNAGWIKPDLWREMETLINMLRLKSVNIDPRKTLQYATVNGGDLFGVKNYIEEGLEPMIIGLKSDWINPDRSGDLYLSIVKRGGAESIRIRVFGDTLRLI
ncbi:MAG: amidohydrolase family protein [Sulfolobales archaeon]